MEIKVNTYHPLTRHDDENILLSIMPIPTEYPQLIDAKYLLLQIYPKTNQISAFIQTKKSRIPTDYRPLDNENDILSFARNECDTRRIAYMQLVNSKRQ